MFSWFWFASSLHYLNYLYSVVSVQFIYRPTFIPPGWACSYCGQLLALSLTLQQSLTLSRHVATVKTEEASRRIRFWFCFRFDFGNHLVSHLGGILARNLDQLRTAASYCKSLVKPIGACCIMWQTSTQLPSRSNLKKDKHCFACFFLHVPLYLQT